MTHQDQSQSNSKPPILRESEARAVVEAVERHVQTPVQTQVHVVEARDRHGRKCVPQIVYRDYDGTLTLRDIEDAPLPDHPSGARKFRSTAGFVEYVRTQVRTSQASTEDAPKGGKPLLFGELAGMQITARFNAPQAGEWDHDDHMALLYIEQGSDWVEWVRRADAGFSQRELLEWLDDRRDDFTGDNYERTRDYVKELTAKAKMQIRQTESETEYSDAVEGSVLTTHDARIAVQPIEGGPVIGLTVRFRGHYDSEKKKLSASYRILGADSVLRKVFVGPAPVGDDGAPRWTTIAEEVSAALGQPVMF